MFKTLPLHQRSKFLRRFFKPAIYPEAFFAYFHKLPNTVAVDWFRDDGMIVGTVRVGEQEFMTQGTDAEDFIRMVNESIVTACNIPDDYFEAVSKAKTYLPQPSERMMLEDLSVPRHSFGLAKNEQAFKLA